MTDDYDQFVCSEIFNPNDVKLYETVTQCMIHGPCGEDNPNAACMIEDQDGTKQCSKKFPKRFVDKTSTNNQEYPVYRRRDN